MIRDTSQPLVPARLANGMVEPGKIVVVGRGTLHRSKHHTVDRLSQRTRASYDITRSSTNRRRLPTMASTLLPSNHTRLIAPCQQILEGLEVVDWMFGQPPSHGVYEIETEFTSPQLEL